MNRLGSYGQTGWVDMDRRIGRPGPMGQVAEKVVKYRWTDRYRHMSRVDIDKFGKYGWTVGIKGHIDVDIDGRVGIYEQVGQIWTHR